MKFLLTAAAVAAIAFAIPVSAQEGGFGSDGATGVPKVNSPTNPTGAPSSNTTAAPGATVPGQRSAEDGAVTNPAMPHGNMDTSDNTSTGMSHKP